MAKENQNQEYLQIKDISKSYGVVHALDHVSFSVRKGEIHALLGENGAGKSTLVKIIMSEEQPDAGEICLDGKPLPASVELRRKSIQMVHQELAIFENMTVAENMFPWMLSKGIRINWKEINQKTQAALDRFELKSIKPTQKMDTVNLAGQQMVEILRCIYAEPKVLLLDEPTSGLNDVDAEKLMRILEKLREEGCTIIYISHRLNEIVNLADRVTVMRDGQYICTLEGEEITEQNMISSMVGRDFSEELYSRKGVANAQDSPVILEVKDLQKKEALNASSLQLHQGEVLGVFGIEGSGTDKLSRMMFGLEAHDSGTVLVEGQEIRNINPETMIDSGVMYLNSNRKYAGLLLDMPIADNVAVPMLKSLANKLSFLKTGNLNEVADRYVKELDIATPSVQTHPRRLSGGNQQKVMLSICLAKQPKILIVNEPTRGIDVGVKIQIHDLLTNYAKEGISIIVFSSEMPELMALCDRIIVMKERSVAGELSGAAISEEAIMHLASATDAGKGANA